MTGKNDPEQDSDAIHFVTPQDPPLKFGYLSQGQFVSVDWVNDELKPHKPRRTDSAVAKIVLRALFGVKI